MAPWTAVLDWVLPAPGEGNTLLKQTVLVWRRVWIGAFTLAVLLGWVSLRNAPRDWLTYLSYDFSALIGLVAVFALSWRKPLPSETYRHGALPVLVGGPSLVVTTFFAALLGPKSLFRAIHCDSLADIADNLHLAGAQTGFRAPEVVLSLAVVNAFVGCFILFAKRRA